MQRMDHTSNRTLRDRLTLPADVDRARAEELARSSEAVQRFLEGKTVRKVVYVPGRLLNFVV